MLDWAFASAPQSGLAWFCFLSPLIEPDWQISRIRLLEKTHASWVNKEAYDAICQFCTQLGVARLIVNFPRPSSLLASVFN
jgi:hypothetical protein